MIRTFEPRQTRRSSVLPPSSGPLRLRIRQANGTKRTIRITSAKCTIGSQKGCTIRIPAQGENGVHCMLLRSRGRVVVRNWGNDGTINGHAFEIAPLHVGDTLRIGGCAIRIQKNGKKQNRVKRSPAIDVQFGKRLVGEIGKRLAHLEDRLVARQKRLSRQVQSANPRPAIDQPNAQFAAPIAPVVVEGLNTLRSAVEELRSQVAQVANRPWPAPESPAIDTEALLQAASVKMGEVVQTSLREDRTHSAIKFEQITRDFDRIGEQLGAVEQKLNLRVTDLVAEQVQPVSQTVEFVRSGLQAMEDRQTLEASRFEKLAGGLDALRQSTIERLGAMSDTMGAIPSLAKVEDSLAMVSAKVEGLSREIAQRQERFFTREDAASLLEQLEAASTVRNEHEERFAEIGEHFAALKGEWSEFQAGTRDQLEAIAAKIDSMPLQTAASVSTPVDLAPIEHAIAACEAKLGEQAVVLDSQATFREQVESRIDAATASIEAIRGEVSSRDYGSKFDELTNEMSSTRDAAAEAVEQTRTAQREFLDQLVALENRCEYLESELARLSRTGVSASPVLSTYSMQPPSEPAADDSEPVDPAVDSSIAPPASAYYVNPYDQEAGESADEGSAGAPSYLNEESEAESVSAKLTETSRFDALTRSAIQSQLETETNEHSKDESSSQAEPTVADEDVVIMPNSVVESLRRSGIWKDGTKQESATSDASDDPRDIVGSNFNADSTPPTGLDPGKHPSDQLAKNAWEGPHPRHGENEDESIDAYMERLLQRVSGSGGEVTGAMAVAEHLQKAKAQASKKKEARPEDDGGEFEYTPRGPAPEKSSDLSALRELAMTSANVNIQNYHAANKAKRANEKWIVVVVAMICAMGLLYICVNYKSDWTYLAAGAAFVVALHWAILASFTNVAAKRALPKEGESKNESSKRRKTDKPGVKSLLDQQPIGETFQAHVDERGHEQEVVANPDLSATAADSNAEFYRTLDQLMPGKREKN